MEYAGNISGEENYWLFHFRHDWCISFLFILHNELKNVDLRILKLGKQFLYLLKFCVSKLNYIDANQVPM